MEITLAVPQVCVFFFSFNQSLIWWSCACVGLVDKQRQWVKAQQRTQTK